VKLTIQLRLGPRSRIRGAIPPLPQYTFMARCLVKAQGQLYLYKLKRKIIVVIYERKMTNMARKNH
jgi:hypothetical protein